MANQAIRDQIEGWDAIARLRDEQKTLNVDLQRARGDEAGARLVELSQATAKMTEEQKAAYVAQYNLNQQIRAQIALVDALKQTAEKFLTAGMKTSNQYAGIAGDLVQAGFNITGPALEAASVDSLYAAAVAIYDMADVSDDMRLALVKAMGGLMDLKMAAIQTTAGLVQAAQTAKRSAGDLLDRIDKALGGTGDRYAKLREAELWAAMQTADYKQQIELAGQLTDIVLSRHQAEEESAKRQLDFARQLRDYVDSLRVGNLSPLTTAERLSEAQKQYAETLALAVTGDEKAMQDLQNKASAYLDLARTYYASSDDYTAIFNSVTTALENLGVTTETEAQQQLTTANAQLDQLKSLQDVLTSAYAAAQADFDIQLATLERQLTEMSKVANGVGLVAEILSGLPAELAGLLSGVIAGQGVGTPVAPFPSTPRPGGSANPALPSYDPVSDTGVLADGAVWQGSAVRDAAAEVLAMEDGPRRLYDLVKESGYTMSVAESALRLPSGTMEDWAKSVGLPVFHDGTPYVPDTGLALLQRGERVMPAAENAKFSEVDWGGVKNDQAELVAELRALHRTVAALERQVAEFKAQAHADSVQQTVILAQATNEGSELVAENLAKASHQASALNKAVLL